MDSAYKQIQNELSEGITLKKCRHCGCMESSINSLQSLISENKIPFEQFPALVQTLSDKMLPIKYDCLGCEHCYPAVAENLLYDMIPDAAIQNVTCNQTEINCDNTPEEWPPVPGEYFVYNSSNPVAVSTLASPDLAEELIKKEPEGLCIAGKTETENIGIEKVVQNIISNKSIKFLIIAGNEPEKHFSGDTLFSIWTNGVDENMKVINAKGRRPVLKNLDKNQIEAFRNQIQVFDMKNCEDVDAILQKVAECADKVQSSCDCNELVDVSESRLEKIVAQNIEKVVLDRYGYFVIIPQQDKNRIIVEHYANDNTLLRVIEGRNARELYLTILNNGWVSQMSHAAYLGKELTRAEFSLTNRTKFIQDRA